LITRGARFFIVAFVCHRYGDRAREIIEKRLELWAAVFAGVVVVGIVAAVYLV
jgi:hypothetical protein